MAPCIVGQGADVGSRNPFKPGKADMGSGQGHAFGRNYTC
jgi:hypothetical protein